MTTTAQRPTLRSSLAFCGYVLVKPFKGFYELKYERRGTTGAGFLFLLLYFISAVTEAIGTGYAYNPDQGTPVNIGMVFLRSVIPITLFCIANWCLTLMLNGEGTMPQIFMGLCYALIPMTAVNFINTLLSNVLTLNESAYIHFLTAAAFLWTGLLVVVCVMEINQYSFTRAIAACLLSIVGIAVLLLIFLLCFSLVQQILVFIQSIYKELSYRW